MKHTLSLILILLAFQSVNSQHLVTGHVVDENGVSMPGVTVKEINSSNITVTSFDGVFEIFLKVKNSRIEFSSIGYSTVFTDATAGENYKIILHTDETLLEEVVLIGYGKSKLTDLTGSISSVRVNDVTATQSHSLESILKGRAAGVQVSNNGSEVGGSQSIKIRGLASLTNNSEPLYVIDGVILGSTVEDATDPFGDSAANQYSMFGINPKDILRIEILKDASATAIYGSRGANGVIIITTKNGISGETKVNYSADVTIGNVTRNIDVLNTQEYAQYQNAIQTATGGTPTYIINADGSISDSDNNAIESVNWSDELYRSSLRKRHRVSVFGGDEKNTFYFSGGITKNESILPNSEAKISDFNAKLSNQINPRLKLNTKVNVSFTELSALKGVSGLGSTNSNMSRQIVLGAPLRGLEANFIDISDIDNSVEGPLSWVKDYDDLSDEIRFLGSLNLDYKINDNFTYRVSVSGDYRNKDRKIWYGVGTFKGFNANGTAGISTLKRFRYNIDNTLLYNFEFNESHKIDGTLGFLYDRTNINTSSYTSSNFADKILRADGISFGENFSALNIDSFNQTIVSFIGRVNYNLIGKYLLTGTIRADGSSNFTVGNQWAYFPSLAFAWKLGEEQFLENVDFISSLKLRAGYGQVGNQNIPAYSASNLFGGTNIGITDASGGNLINIAPLNLSNPSILWETSEQYNSGVDFSFFNYRINGTVDVYYKNSKNLLINIPIPPSSGFESVIANQGNLSNRGVELALDIDIIKNNNDWNWNIYGNIATNVNRVEDLGLPPTTFGALGEQVGFLGSQISSGSRFKQPANVFLEGEQAGLFFGYETQGIITNTNELSSTGSDAKNGNLAFKGTELEVGDVYFVDTNGDGNIDDDDKKIIGNPNPEYNYGFGSVLSYKNISFDILFNGVHGNDIVNGGLIEEGYANNSAKNIRGSAYHGAFDATTNPTGTYPSVNVGGTGRSSYDLEFNDRLVEDGSFLRLSHVSVSYNLPVSKLKGIEKASVSLSGQNLYLWTNYSGFDPEVNSFSYDPTRVGIDWGSFPNTKTFMMGLNVQF
ncbi:SusC/RagA family TonB-linked outer membrane protein [Flavobacteriaceae bacterium]|nr:SusC/RagA family TonB-linked outer membrane protein [Flavobacteriaceae bacterium]